MASFTNAQAIFGLSAESEATGTRTTGSVLVGLPQTAIRFSNVGIQAWSFRAIFSANSAGEKVTFKCDGTSIVPDTSFVAGAAQAEYINGAGTISTAGNATITVTSAGMSGSPKAISFAVALSDTPAMWIAKAKAALEADAIISNRFSVSVSGVKLTLTRKPLFTNENVSPSLNYYAANDSTMNIAVANGTCAGITAVTTSTTQTSGVLTSGIKLLDGDGKDWEGNTIDADQGVIYAVLIENLHGDTAFSNDEGMSIYLFETQKAFLSGNDSGGLVGFVGPQYIKQGNQSYSDTIITILCA